jgi:F0F1-type ATP synthase membrane subunit c/vacuolar-type H+-ATPase subunit K
MDPIATATIVRTMAIIGAAIAMGFGAIGPAVGIGISGGFACLGISRQPQVQSHLFRTMLIGQAVSSTPPTFALVVAVLLLFQVPYGPTLIQGFSALGAGISIGVASFASGPGSSFPASQACTAIARQPRLRKQFLIQMLLGQALTQTALVFALMISFLLLFVPKSPFAMIVDYIAVLSAGICMGFGAIGASLGSGIATASVFLGVKHHQDAEKAMAPLTVVMLLGVAVAHASCIYALIVSLSLFFTAR